MHNVALYELFVYRHTHCPTEMIDPMNFEYKSCARTFLFLLTFFDEPINPLLVTAQDYYCLLRREG